MRFTKSLSIVGLAAALLALVIVSAAFATEKTNPTSGAVCGTCRGIGGGAINAIAGLLGMDAADIRTERQNGRSLADIADEKGVSENKLVDTIYEARKAQLDARVKAGELTQEQADAIASATKDSIKNRVESSDTGGCSVGGGGVGAGGCGGNGGSGSGGCGGGAGGGNCSGYGPGVAGAGEEI